MMSHEVNLEVHGLRILIRCHNERLAREALRDFKPHLSRPQKTVDVRFNFYVAGSNGPQVPVGAIRDVLAPNMEIWTLSSGIRYFRFARKSQARINLETGSVDAFLERRMERTKPRSFVKWGIIRGLERKSRFPLHSSAIMDGARIRIFVGRSGAGKTTLLVYYLLHGHILLTDDVLFLGRRRIYPFLLRGDVREGTLNRLRQERRLINTHLRPGLVDLGSIFPSIHDELQSDKVSLYYLNVRQSRESKLRHVNPKRMLGLLIDSYISEMSQSYWCGWDTATRVSRAMQAYSEILENADCYEVFAGSDLAQLYGLIQRTRD